MKTETGICPFCKSTNIEYFDVEWIEAKTIVGFIQPCRCTDCGCEFKEEYKTEHIDTQIID